MTTHTTIRPLPDTLPVTITPEYAALGVQERFDDIPPWTPLTRALVTAAAKYGWIGSGAEIAGDTAIIRTGAGEYRYDLGEQGRAVADAIGNGEDVVPVTLQLQRIRAGE